MLIRDLPVADATITGDAGREVTAVSLDSRAVAPGCLYAALPGANVHGARFIPDVFASGVRAVLTDPAGLEIARAVAPQNPGLGGDATFIVVDDPRGQLGAVAAAVYGTTPGHPELLGITGTNGKTTTTFIVEALLAALQGRAATAVIGTVATHIAGHSVPAVRTTPEAPALHGLFKQMREAGVRQCAMEVSSHALVQHRVDGAHFAVAGFTNLSQDHLDFHITMENYFKAKAELFTPAFSSRGVVYLADDWARRLARESWIPVLTVSADPADTPDFLVTPIGDDRFDLTAAAGQLADVGGTLHGRSPLPGAFNVANTALALTMLLADGFQPTDVAAVSADFSVTVPGRMEVVNPRAPRAIVDYSHTPDALEKVLSGLAADSQRPLVVVVGAGGDRDHGKRPKMGAVAAAHADVVIITDDNPRSEDPAAIRASVLAGANDYLAAHSQRSVDVREIGSRAAAITAGVEAAGRTGTVLVAGKGHETGQEIAGVKHHFDDREQTSAAVAAGGYATHDVRPKTHS